MSQNNLNPRLDSPTLPSFSPTLSEKKLSCITEVAVQQPHFLTFLNSPSPPLSQNSETPILPNSRSFLYSPSINSERGDSPILPTFSSKHSSTYTASSDFGGAYPTPPNSYLRENSSPSTHYRPSWCSGLSTASTSVSPYFQSRTERLSDILPDDLDLYAKEFELEPVQRFGAVTRPVGLGFELPFIAEQDFAYYPRVERAGQTEVVTRGGRRSEEAEVVRRKGGVRFMVGKLVRRVLMKIGVRRYV